MSELTEKSAESLKSGYKRLCIRLGLMIIVIFVSRGVSTIVLSLLQPSLANLGATGAYLVQTAFSLVFLYIIPMIATVLLLKMPLRELNKKIYTKPK